MNNGWFIGLTNWEPVMPVRSAGSTRDGHRWKMPLAYTKNFILKGKKKFILFLPSCFELCRMVSLMAGIW